MRTSFLLFLAIVTLQVFSQDKSCPDPSDVLPPDTNEVFSIVDTLPEYPGGDAAMFKFIRENFIYPGDYCGVQGKVWVAFVVDKDGSITDVKILKGTATPLDREAMRVVRLMPKWKPGKHNGHTVRVRYNLPISIHPK